MITNKEKFMDEIIATYLYNEYDTNELQNNYNIQKDEYGDITYDCILKWLKSEYNEKQNKYAEVTNDINRFKFIEVRDNENEKWITRQFLAVLDEHSTHKRYLVIDKDSDKVTSYKYARTLLLNNKPTDIVSLLECLVVH